MSAAEAKFSLSSWAVLAAKTLTSRALTSKAFCCRARLCCMLASALSRAPNIPPAVRAAPAGGFASGFHKEWLDDFVLGECARGDTAINREKKGDNLSPGVLLNLICRCKYAALRKTGQKQKAALPIHEHQGRRSNLVTGQTVKKGWMQKFFCRHRSESFCIQFFVTIASNNQLLTRTPYFHPYLVTYKESTIITLLWWENTNILNGRVLL
jgi:hypothetical protein